MRRLLVCLFVLIVSAMDQIVVAQSPSKTLVDQDGRVLDVSTTVSGDRWVICREVGTQGLVDVYVEGINAPLSIPVSPDTFQAEFLPDGETLVTATRNGGGSVLRYWKWDPKTRLYDEVGSTDKGGNGFSISLVDSRVLMGSEGGVAHWRGPGSAVELLFRAPGMRLGNAITPAVSVDGQAVVTGFVISDELAIYHENSFLTSTDAGGLQRTSLGGTPLAVAFSPDNRYLAISVVARAGGTSKVSVYEWPSLRQLPHHLSVSSKLVKHLAFHDDTLVCAGSWYDKTVGRSRRDPTPYVSLWDVQTNQRQVLVQPIDEETAKKLPFRPHRKEMTAVAISRKYELLLTASSDGLVHVWRFPPPDRQAARR